MKIVVTGSLGHISKPLAQMLVQKGHSVTVISSNSQKEKDIQSLGAKAAIGSIDDADFLTAVFSGADIVYAMEPPIDFKNSDFGFWINVANSYVHAIENSGVKQVVHLSSIGAHTETGNGLLRFHYQVENIFRRLLEDVAIKFMRPVGFYYNMFAFISAIKSQGAIVSNYGGDQKEPWVSPIDIALTIADEMEKPFDGREILYIASDEASPNEVAVILGNAIGKPDLQWLVIPDEQLLNGLLSAGLTSQAAYGLVDMNAGRRTGVLYEDYYRHKPTLGKIKLRDFAKEFATVFNQ